MRKLIVAILFLACFATTSSALPYLQLDISNGVYVGAPDETVFSDGTPFKLYALVDPSSNFFTDGNTYYISAAVLPALPDASASLGSFSFDGTAINVTDDMTFGTPPIELIANNLDLQSHGVFETFFKEFTFDLGNATKVVPYNVQIDPGGYTLAAAAATDYLLAVAFDVDVTSLDDAYEIHFDLYTKSLNNRDNLYIDKNAPFSHDAQSSRDGFIPPLSVVPEPSTLILLGAGLIGLAAYRRKKH